MSKNNKSEIEQAMEVAGVSTESAAIPTAEGKSPEEMAKLALGHFGMKLSQVNGRWFTYMTGAVKFQGQQVQAVLVSRGLNELVITADNRIVGTLTALNGHYAGELIDGEKKIPVEAQVSSTRYAIPQWLTLYPFGTGEAKRSIEDSVLSILTRREEWKKSRSEERASGIPTSRRTWGYQGYRARSGLSM